jgi:hypothetical protein
MVLHKIKDDVVVTGVTVLSGQTKHYKGRRSLTVSNTTVNSGGNATFTSQKLITFQPGFVAQAGSRVSAYIAPPDCSETPLREEKGGMMDVGFSMKTTNSTKIELLFEGDSTNSTKTTEIEVDFEADFLGDFISVFPNPANSTVTVQLHSGNLKASLVSIKLMDLIGREILLQQVSGQSYTIDVSSYPKGVYFIEVKDINKIYHQKIIIN